MSKAPASLAILIVLLASLSLVPASVVAQPSLQITVSGVVVDGKSGGPLSASVQVYTFTSEGSRAYNETKTDSNGRYSMQIAAGKGMLSAHAADGEHEYWSRDIDLSSSQTVRIEMVPFPPKTAILDGVVTDANSGKPIQGAHVSLGGYAYATTAGAEGGAGYASTTTARDMPASSPPSDGIAPDRCCYNGGESALTDAAGRYRITSYAGTYHVTVRSEGYAWAEATVDLVAGRSARKDFALDPVPPMDAGLTGVVTDMETGRPVAGAQVSASNLQWGVYNSTWTDASGRFSIRTMPGYTQVWVNAWKAMEVVAMAKDASYGAPEPAFYPYPGPNQGAAKNYYPWTDATRLVSGSNDLSISLKPKPEPTQVVQGYVVDAQTGKALAGAWINVRNEDTGEWGSARTGDDGSYKLLLRSGWLVFDAGAEGHFSRSTAFALGDAATTRLDIVLEPGTPRYGGGCCIAYAEGGAAPMAAYDTKSGDSASRLDSGGSTSTAAPTPTTSRQATGTYSGGAGGMGPYDGKAVTEPAATVGAGDGNKTVVPGASAVVVAIGAIAAAVVALRRRN